MGFLRGLVGFSILNRLLGGRRRTRRRGLLGGIIGAGVLQRLLRGNRRPARLRGR